jgi:hypothetical protein
MGLFTSSFRPEVEQYSNFRTMPKFESFDEPIMAPPVLTYMPENVQETPVDEPVSDRLKKITKGQLHAYTDDELLALNLARSKTDDIQDAISEMDIKNAMTFDDDLNSDIFKKQKQAGLNAYRGSRVLFDQVKEDYMLNIEDTTPWWAQSADSF